MYTDTWKQGPCSRDLRPSEVSPDAGRQVVGHDGAAPSGERAVLAHMNPVHRVLQWSETRRISVKAGRQPHLSS